MPGCISLRLPYLARFKGLSRTHTDSDLRAFLSWCAGRDIEPLQAQRAQLELYVRWMQETRRYKPSTVSRRTSVVRMLACHRDWESIASSTAG